MAGAKRKGLQQNSPYSQKKRISKGNSSILLNTRKRKVSLQTGKSKRSTRVQKKPERYGHRLSAIDRDAFFEQLSTTTESTCSNDNTPQMNQLVESCGDSNDTESAYSSCSCSDNGSSSSTVTEPSFLSKLNEILVRISAIEKNTAKTDVRVRNLETSIDRVDHSVTVPENLTLGLLELGLPLKFQQSLDKFESDLQSADFRHTTVKIQIDKPID